MNDSQPLSDMCQQGYNHPDAEEGFQRCQGLLCRGMRIMWIHRQEPVP